MKKTTRTVNDEEIQQIEGAIAYENTIQRKYRITIMATLVVLAALGVIILLGWVERILAASLAIFGLLLIQSLVAEIQKKRERATKRMELLNNGHVNVYEIEPSSAIKIEDTEDLGEEYFFQVTPAAILYLTSQELEESEGFPSDKMEIVIESQWQDFPEIFEIKSRGKKLAEITRVDNENMVRIREKYDLYSMMSTFPGKLEDILQELRTPGQPSA